MHRAMNLRVPQNAGNFLTACQNYELHEKDSAAWSQTAQADTQITKATNGPFLLSA